MTQTEQIQKQRAQYVITDTVETAGAISYWRLASDTSLATLTAAWKKHGLAEDVLPKAPKIEVALGRAVNEQAEKRRLVRPLARRGAWAIVEESVRTAEDANYKLPPVSYRTLVTVGVGKPDIAKVDATDEEHNALIRGIDDAFQRARNSLAHSDISSWLLDVAAKLGSVSLRDSGGVYFIPRKNVSIWDKVADALEETGSIIFRIPAMKTADAMAAITDAISAEAEALTAKMEEELLAEGDDALGKRALKTRAESALMLLDKLATYEDLIGKQLDIRKRVEMLSANVAAAALTAETAPESA